MPSIAELVLRKEPRHIFRRDRSVLEASLWKYWHLDAEYLPNAARDDLPFHRVQALVRPFRQLRKRKRLGDGDHRRTSVGAELVKAVGAGARVAAHAAATIATLIRERVLDRLDATAFLIEHALVDDAANRQLAVRLDPAVLEILGAAIAVDEEAPLGVAVANRG